MMCLTVRKICCETCGEYYCKVCRKWDWDHIASGSHRKKIERGAFFLLFLLFETAGTRILWGTRTPAACSVSARKRSCMLGGEMCCHTCWQRPRRWCRWKASSTSTARCKGDIFKGRGIRRLELGVISYTTVNMTTQRILLGASFQIQMTTLFMKSSKFKCHRMAKAGGQSLPSPQLRRQTFRWSKVFSWSSFTSCSPKNSSPGGFMSLERPALRFSFYCTPKVHRITCHIIGIWSSQRRRAYHT